MGFYSIKDFALPVFLERVAKGTYPNISAFAQDRLAVKTKILLRGVPDAR